VVVLIAVLIGGVFLVIGFDDEGSNTTDGIELGIESERDEEAEQAAEEGTTADPPASVPVFVANGSGVSGQALAVTEQLRAAGYTAPLDPGDAVPALATQVFFLPEQEAEALAVATALGLPADRVAAWPTPPPFAAPPEATVIVSVGPDLAG
jgi:hypothetical protein